MRRRVATDLARGAAALLFGLCAASVTAQAAEFLREFAASPFGSLSRDYFDRFYMDPDAVPADDETPVTSEWRIVHHGEEGSVAYLMAGHLADFLRERAGLVLPAVRRDAGSAPRESKAIVLLESSAGDVPEDGFAIDATPDRITVSGSGVGGLRDGVVRLVDLMGFRQAPFVAHGRRVYTPRLELRVGIRSSLGSMRDVVFHGFNGVTTGMNDLYGLSDSAAMTELVSLQRPEYRERVFRESVDAKRLGLKSYLYVHTMHKFREDDPIFTAHPEIRGVRTWFEDGLFTLCTEADLVKRYLKESVQGLFRDHPGLDGLLIIIGGEGFYHCYMRPYGLPPGETTCERCRALGPDQTVANLCNFLADCAREVNPEAEIVVWPYSAMHVWSSDKPHTEFIKRLRPGVALLTEIEKDEVIHKAQGVEKSTWDYSIDLIGPGERALRQIELCREQGVNVYLKSEPELAFEASGLAHIPCMDRWADRADALASAGATGAWVFPAYLPHRGTSTSELNKYLWWDPVDEREALLLRFAARLSGEAAASRLREAWRFVSEAIPFSPEIPPYYQGPHYFGPAHPMCVDPEAELPPQFFAGYGYYAEGDPEKAKIKHPIYDADARVDKPVFLDYYRRMEERLERAVEAIDAATPLVDQGHALTFESEALQTRWFLHIARTQVNFYESCIIRERILDMLERSASDGPLSESEKTEAKSLLARWREVLEDERANAEQSIPVMEADVRLDFTLIGFCPGVELIRAKLELINKEIGEVLPSYAARLGVS